ncbi:MAG TPA: sigma-70 family RNA polymerase sigma factor [Verrucomicrobiae bacterium]
MMTTNMESRTAIDDAALVSETLGGNRDAFAQIVSRYQSLVCSLTYSATGNLGTSEDLAQETFITAWKHLRQLREQDKLRSWLCGIARNRINNFLRREGRQPLQDAKSLEEASEKHSPEPLPVEYTITKEEEAILWRALEKIPENYRETLVLYYRDHQSVETLAAQLDLSVDAVHQRLSRGRKLLQDQVLAFVEGALSRTNPQQAFTHSVVAALPALTVSGKAVTLGAAAKGVGGAKAMGVMGWLTVVLSPLLVLFGFYSNYRMNLAEAETDLERQHTKKFFRDSLLTTLVIALGLAVPLSFIYRPTEAPFLFCELLFVLTIAVYCLSLCYFAFAALPSRRQVLARQLEETHGGNFPSAAYEYRSRASLLGLPLLWLRLWTRD